MPPTLHPYLKRGLDFDASPIHPSGLVEDLPVDHHDEEHQMAKRRRVEAIALQYLRGTPPLILTAGLKGPFTKDWRNPWAQDLKTKPHGQNKGKEDRMERHGKRHSRTSHVASPEASRAAGHTEDHLYSQTELEPLPATAPIPDEDDVSGATDFFSVETEQFIANNSPANPFWLRRSAASIKFPPNSQTDKSPTRPRKRDDRFDSRKTLQLVPPKEPLGGRPLPTRATPPDTWQSSASASMDIVSVAEAAVPTKEDSNEDATCTASSADAPDSSRLRADSAQEEEARSSQMAQYAQAPVPATTPSDPLKQSNVISSEAQPAYAQSFDSLVPATTYKAQSTIQVPQSSPLHRSTRPSRQVIQVTVEPLAGTVPRLESEPQPSPTNCKSTKDSGPTKKLRHDLVASPAPASSTGFIYRRVGQPKGEDTNALKTKPRAVNFSSSPTLNKKDNGQPGVEAEGNISIVEPGLPELKAFSASVQAADRSAIEMVVDEDVQSSDVAKDKDEQQESYKSKQSQYSTQAAMLLAQLEFQEDSTQSSNSSTTLRPWSQPAQNTPPLLPQPSPAITPLSVFNAHTDMYFSDLAGDSALRGPLISTQDLFDAASPFAFSTVKKKSERTRRTSLRLALTSNFRENISAKCPTPSVERVPLKEKNTPTLWSFTHDKISPTTPNPVSQPTTHDVELPQLNLHTSLDFGPNTDFTECFLRSLNNQP